MITIAVYGASAACIQPCLLTCGMVGLKAVFRFSPQWETLNKCVVFTDGVEQMETVLEGNTCIVPAQVLTTAGRTLSVAIHGSDTSGEIVIPTIYAQVGQICAGAGEEGENAVPTAAAQVYQHLAALDARLTHLEQNGVQGSVSTDATLSLAGKAADAGAVGSALEKKQDKGSFVRSVNGVAPDESGNVDLENEGDTVTQEVVKVVSVDTEPVTLDATAPSQTVSLAWNVSSQTSVPAFTNYYIAKSSISYPRTFTASGYTQTWSSSAAHGHDGFVSGHQYFQAMHYVMDGDGRADLMQAGPPDYITPSGTMSVTGSGWIYQLYTPATATALHFGFTNSGSGTGTIDYLYCIDVTALQEAGTITATTVQQLAELFGGLPLVPGEDYEGSVGTGDATLTIRRGSESFTVASGESSAVVQGGDYLTMSGGSVTFLLRAYQTVSVGESGVWAGKKWVAFGDSLTDETINAKKKYYRYIAEKTGITVVAMGQGSTGYWRGQDDGSAYSQRMANVPADADVITIFGSVNDWHIRSNGVSAGSASDTASSGTLAGYINECIDVAMEKAPYAQIALVTPMDYHGLPDDVLDEIVQTICDVAEYRKIKCLDLYHCSGFRVDDPVFAAQYTTDYSDTAEAYGHPSDLAHERLIAPEMMELLRRMILTV